MHAGECDAALPPLRQELRLSRSGSDADGAPQWTLHDPLAHRYFRLGEAEVALLARWGLGSTGALRAALARDGLAWDEARLAELLAFLRTHHLCVDRSASGARSLAREAATARGDAPVRLLRALMFAQRPLASPQRGLERTLPWARRLASPPALALLLAATFAGLYLVSRRWDEFVGSFSGFLTPAGVLLYLLALAGVKALHELGHAYMAVHRGVRVPSFGVAFALGVPMLTTDTSDAWRLASPRDRAWIDAGGVLVELAIAGLATLAWGLLPEGHARDIAFVLATTGWVMSLVLNLNPLARFDGYYLLADALGFDNLQPRAAALLRWCCGRVLGVREARPEAARGGARDVALVAYAAACFAYRLALYVGAALIVYHAFSKVLGIVLLAAEIGLFVLRPALHQWRSWQRGAAERRPRRMRAALLLGVPALALLLPLDRTVAVPAQLALQQDTPLHANEPAQLVEVLARNGQAVRAGDVLYRLQAPAVAVEQAQARLSQLALARRIDRGVADARDRAEQQVLAHEYQRHRAALEGLGERAQALVVRAPHDGMLLDAPPELQPGQWIARERELGRVVQPGRLDAAGYLPERALWRMAAGAAGRFVADDPARATVEVRLRAVERVAAESIEMPLLASMHGGPIAVRRDDHRRLVPASAQHRVLLDVTRDDASDTAPVLLRGVAQIDAEPTSVASEWARHAWRVLMTELRS